MSEAITLASGSDPRFVKRLDRKLARSFLRRPATLVSDKTPVTFSFDDITGNAATSGAGILEDEGVRGTFFVAANLLTKQFGPWQFADMAQVVALHEAGHEIGCHTFSHPDCQTLSAKDLHGDLAKNKSALCEAMPDLELASFAYPYGSVGCEQKRAMLDTFSACRGTHPDINSSRPDLGQLCSFTLNDERIPEERIQQLIEETKAAGGWLVFHTHAVCDQPTAEDCSPELLRRAVRLAKSAGCEILPMRDVLKRHVRETMASGDAVAAA